MNVALCMSDNSTKPKNKKCFQTLSYGNKEMLSYERKSLGNGEIEENLINKRSMSANENESDAFTTQKQKDLFITGRQKLTNYILDQCKKVKRQHKYFNKQ